MSFVTRGALPEATSIRVRPLLGIWLSPRETIRSLVATDPTRGVVVISWLAGVAAFLDALLPKVEPKFPVGMAILMAIAGGPLVIFLLVFVEAYLTAGTGRLLGGRAGLLELRAALAWANAPLLGFLVLWAVHGIVAVPRHAMQALGIALFLWVAILGVVLVAEVQRFSVGRSLGTIVLAWVAKIAIIVGIVLSAS
jgi:hypothetical protein